MKAFAVAKAAHERGYGNGTEIAPVGEALVAISYKP
jgi:hypothetical protein